MCNKHVDVFRFLQFLSTMNKFVFIYLFIYLFIKPVSQHSLFWDSQLKKAYINKNV